MSEYASDGERHAARTLVLFAVLIMAMSPLKAERTPDQSPTTRNVDFAAEEATIAGIHAAVAAGQVTCVQILQAHLLRIEAYDQRGPALNAIITINPAALAAAAELDRTRTASRSPLRALECIP